MKFVIWNFTRHPIIRHGNCHRWSRDTKSICIIRCITAERSNFHRRVETRVISRVPPCIYESFQFFRECVIQLQASNSNHRFRLQRHRSVNGQSSLVKRPPVIRSRLQSKPSLGNSACLPGRGKQSRTESFRSALEIADNVCLTSRPMVC